MGNREYCAPAVFQKHCPRLFHVARQRKFTQTGEGPVILACSQSEISDLRASFLLHLRHAGGVNHPDSDLGEVGEIPVSGKIPLR